MLSYAVFFFIWILLKLLHTMNGSGIHSRPGDDVMALLLVSERSSPDLDKLPQIYMTLAAHYLTVKGQIFI